MKDKAHATKRKNHRFLSKVDGHNVRHILEIKRDGDSKFTERKKVNVGDIFLVKLDCNPG